MKLSLLSFNTQGTPFFSPDLTLRYKKFCELINKENPDIICFQEIATYYNFLLLKKQLTYPYLVFKPFLHAPKGGLVIASKIPLEDVQFLPFSSSGSLWNISRMSRVVKNGMLIAKIKDTNLTLINTHTFSDFEFDWSPTNRLYGIVKLQAEQVIKEVNKLTQAGQRVILTGDLNSKKGSRLYKTVLSETKMLDAFVHDSFPTYYNDRLNYKFKGKSSERIDIIFFHDPKKKLKASSPSYLFEKKYTLANKKSSYLSDHIGMKVDFDMV